MRFKYCPDCGTKAVFRTIGDEGEIPYCEKCQKPLFDMCSSCILALVVNEYDEVLVLRQDYISDKYCNLVSGYIKPGESAEESAQREVFEECGVKIKTLLPVGTFYFAKKDLLMIGYICKADKCELTLSDEVDKAMWVKGEKALEMVHPKGNYSYALVEKYLKMQKQ